MIAVVGRLEDAATVAIARRAVGGGSAAQLVATVPLGSDGDRHLGELASAGVGHAAALRSPSATLEPADADLALRYLPDLRVVILVADAASLGPAVADAAAWAGARLIVLGTDGQVAGDDPVVLAPPPSDPDEAFAGMVAALAVRLDGGEEPAAAWRAVTSQLGLEGPRVSRAPDPSPRR